MIPLVFRQKMVKFNFKLILKFLDISMCHLKCLNIVIINLKITFNETYIHPYNVDAFFFQRNSYEISSMKI